MTNGAGSKVAEIAIYIGLGSNLGDREANLREAISRIEALGLEITKASSIYETEPVGNKQPLWFLNQVVETRATPELVLSDDPTLGDLLRTASDEEYELLAPFWVYELLKVLLKIEQAMGRERTTPNGPRLIDIDILICGDQEGLFAETRDDPANPGIARAGPPFLSLPHPRLHLRRFVLEPLCEIAPELVHPVLKKTCRELLESLEDASVVRTYESKK